MSILGDILARIFLYLNWITPNTNPSLAEYITFLSRIHSIIIQRGFAYREHFGSYGNTDLAKTERALKPVFPIIYCCTVLLTPNVTASWTYARVLNRRGERPSYYGVQMFLNNLIKWWEEFFDEWVKILFSFRLSSNRDYRNKWENVNLQTE